MNPTIIDVPYDPVMVLMSYLVSTVGAYVALAATAQARSRGTISRASMFSIGLALGGVGIWAAHFLGMIAFRIPIGHGYAVGETLLSLVAAVAVSAVAIGYLGQDRNSRQRLLTAGPLAGLAVAVMHYLGMYGLRFEGYLAWNWPLVAASVVIAIVTATTALWLAFNTTGHLARAGGAALMGAAVCAMHYTGMAAATVCSTPTQALAWGDWVLRPGELPSFVVVLAVLVLLLVSMDTMLRTLQPAAKPRNPA